MENQDTDSQIIQLGRHSDARIPTSSLFDTLIEKFFLVGGLASFIGGAIIGAHLWLMLNGQMKIAVNYAELRTLHSLMQTYLFFGLFILGFLLQTAPRILKVPDRAPPRFLAYIPLLCFGLYLELTSSTHILGPIFIACLLYTSPSPRDGLLSRMPSSA